jgi:hypothetical protein
MIWASCLDHEISIEDDVLGHGIFMNFVVEGLAGHADVEVAGNHDGQLSPHELFAFAAVKTTYHARNSFASRQQPWFKGEFTADLQLTKLSKEQIAKLGKSVNRFSFLQTPEQLHAKDEYSKAVHALQNGDLDSAIRLCKSSIGYDSNPKSNDAAYRMRAMAYRLKGDLQPAVADYEKVGTKTQVRVISEEAPLQAGNDRLGTLRQGDIVDVAKVNVTVNRGKKQVWYWVDSIERAGDTSKPRSLPAKGWVMAEHLETRPQGADAVHLAQQFQKQNQFAVSKADVFGRFRERSSDSIYDPGGYPIRGTIQQRLQYEIRNPFDFPDSSPAGMLQNALRRNR